MKRTIPMLAVMLAAFCAAPVSRAQEQPHDTTPLKPYPWAPTLPRDYTKDRLTAADWVGPDGIVYPNWSWAGVHIGAPGQRKPGIPQVTKIFATLPAELAGATNGEAFTAALVKAIDACGEAGGGVIQIPAGTYVLTRPILIRQSRIVLRGAGRGQAVEAGGRDDPQETRLQFNFAYGVAGEPAVKMLTFPLDGRITRDSEIGFYAQAFSSKSSAESQQNSGKTSHLYAFEIVVTPQGKPPFTLGIIKNWNNRQKYDKAEAFAPSGPTTAVSLNGDKLYHELKDVECVTFETKVVWRWKEKRGKEQVELEDSASAAPVTFSTKDYSQLLPDRRKNMVRGASTEAILFVGDGKTFGKTGYLLSDARRGDTRLRVALESVEQAVAKGVVPGAMIRLGAYNSKSFAAAIERDGGSGTSRDQMCSVASVSPAEGEGVFLDVEQPLQFDFPANEGEVDEWDAKQGKYVQTGTRSTWFNVILPIEACGVEDLVLEQTQRIWFSGIRASDAMNCWIRNVRVERPGRDPANLGGMMNEMRDCEFIDPIWANNTGGGSAYLHGSTFGLIDNVYCRNARHAPNFSGNTAGVIRNSRFFSSDLQWHQNWGRSHLIENCTVDALEGTGSYGYGAFAQRSIADIHGPGMGPRNVIYNCDLIGPKGGIFLGGKSESPLILHNRVRAWTGPGLILRYHVFNGLFLGNVFAVQNRFEPCALFGDLETDKSRLNRTAERPKPRYHPGLGAANPGNDFIGNTLYGGSGVLAEGTWESGGQRSEWRRSYGNDVKAWDPNPPRPQPAMASVFETQRAHPEGFATLKPETVLYNPDPAFRGTPDPPMRDDGLRVAQVNFRDSRGDKMDQPAHWRGQEPGQGWFSDLGEPFGEKTGPDGATLRYGWVGGKPEVRQESIWSDDDFRYRTTADWPPPKDDPLRLFGRWTDNRDLAWQIELPPGSYCVFLAAGSPRKPERFTWPDERPLPFLQVNDFLLNDVVLKDPGQSDVRRDAFWATVTVGENRLLSIRPAPTAITPRIAFIQIHRSEKRVK